MLVEAARVEAVVFRLAKSLLVVEAAVVKAASESLMVMEWPWRHRGHHAHQSFEELLLKVVGHDRE